MDSQTSAAEQNWSRRWRSWLLSMGLIQGTRSSARVKQLEVHSGYIEAAVQPRSGPTCTVSIRFATWDEEIWQRVVDALGGQAIFAAQLLAGDFPPELERAIASAGVDLLPARVDEIEHQCSCDLDVRHPCEHVAAVYTALGELLPEDPWLLFRLRGRDQQTLLRALRAQRNRSSRTSDTNPAAGTQPAAAQSNGESGFYRAGATTSGEELAPLPTAVDAFWGSTKTQDEFYPHIVPPNVELALLRRLGPLPPEVADEATYEGLVTIYREISRIALDVAFAESRIRTESDGEEPNSDKNGDPRHSQDNGV